MKRLKECDETLPYGLYIFPIEVSTSTGLKEPELSGRTPKSEEHKILQIQTDVHNNSDTVSSPDIVNSSIENADYSIVISTEKSEILQSLLESEYFETGIKNQSESNFDILFMSDRLSAMNMLLRIFMDNYSMDRRRVNVLVGILHILSHKKYEEVYPLGQSMAINSLSHRENEVAEYGIKCFENWGHADGIDKLKAVNYSSKWLCDYAHQVIEELHEGD